MQGIPGSSFTTIAFAGLLANTSSKRHLSPRGQRVITLLKVMPSGCTLSATVSPGNHFGAAASSGYRQL